MPVIFRREMTPKHFLDLQRTWIFQKYDVTLLVCGGGDDFAEEQIIGLPTGLRILLPWSAFLTEKRRKFAKE